MSIAVRATIAAAAVGAAILLNTCHAKAADRPVSTAIVFVIDCSNSMDQREVAFVREAHVQAITSDDVLQAIRSLETQRVAMAYVEFTAGAAKAAVDWMVVSDAASARAFTDAIAAPTSCGALPSGNTPVGEGLKAAAALLASLPYEADRLVVDVVGDGIDNNGAPGADVNQDVSPDVAAAREALLAMGAVINGLPMVLDTTSVGLVEWYCGAPGTTPAVRGGYGSFCRTLDRIEDLPQELHQKIVLELY